MYHLFVEPFEVGFMQRALIVSLLIGGVGGVIGVYVVLRKRAFFADTLTHTVFPGVAIAFVAGSSLWLGALLAGIASAVLFTVSTTNRRVDDDAAMAILLTTFFAVGVMVVSRITTYTNDLVVLLFGRVLTVDRGEIITAAALGAVALLIVAVLHKELVFQAFDPEGLRAAGYPPVLLDLAANVAVTLVVVASIQAVGTVLVIALLVTPAAVARLLTRSVGPMIAVGAAVGVACGYLGLVISYSASIDHDLRFAAGATIVVLLTVVFVVVALATGGARRLRTRRVVAVQ